MSFQNPLLKSWDAASKSQRVKILSDFVRVNRNATGADLERDLGPSAMLLFMRITTWLRLTYTMNYELSIQLTALSLFLQGQRFLTSFMENGGLLVIIDILTQEQTNATDRQNALLILIHIANSGRVFREMACDGSAVDIIVQAFLKEDNSTTLELYGSLFLALGQGNPRKTALVQSGLVITILHGGENAALCAATTLRSLQLTKKQTSGANAGMVGAESGSPEAVELLLSAFFRLLESENVKLRYEGAELLQLCAQNAAFVPLVVARLVATMSPDDTLNLPTDEQVSKRDLQLRTACGHTLSQIILHEDPLREVTVTALDVHHVHLALKQHHKYAEEVNDVDSKKECLQALQKLCSIAVMRPEAVFREARHVLQQIE
eukprot:PhF_6_TR33840/c0_g1_i1/m.49631